MVGRQTIWAAAYQWVHMPVSHRPLVLANNNYIDEARPKKGLGKKIQEPNIRANVEKASEMADKRDTKHRCQI